ncbi:MAG: hypothetical protein IT531_16705 [Burkholderiales bacterium]|nr:hypothetical protein [Burkholderiales bacterium]
MAEAEDVITDAARHATVFARELWRRQRPRTALPRPLALADIASRLELLVAAVTGTSYSIRPAQPPAPTTMLRKIFQRREPPPPCCALPATDGASIWLPPSVGHGDARIGAERYRALALQQATRAARGSAGVPSGEPDPLVRDLYLVFEAYAADHALAQALPGMVTQIDALRREALSARAPLERLAAGSQALEALVRSMLERSCLESHPRLPLPATPAHCWQAARECAERWALEWQGTRRRHACRLLKDLWTGELRPPPAPHAGSVTAPGAADFEHAMAGTRTARLSRRPDVRPARADEDDAKQGAWMIQTTQPHEHAEDGFGMQRPTDRDEHTAAEDFADSLAELPAARLVTTPGQPKEILLADDPPERIARRAGAPDRPETTRICYPEWDFRSGAYRQPGAIVRLLPPALGSQLWVERTLAEHGALLPRIRRRFEMLRALPMRLRKQLDGDDVDLAAYIDAYADYRAGRPMGQSLYALRRRVRRDVALLLLIDVSGSTDAWIAAHRRVIDVEREALLLVCVALEGLAEPYAVQAFSGDGPGAVTLRPVKDFQERYGEPIARRIAALEPEHYTRAGAALRHASACLMRQGARHRLLLLLSDGKPNDIDDYDGRYGVEDMRQAVTEARLQGICAFCLTIDRQAATYLPRVFGPNQYALLTEPQRLPFVLLDWMKRLLTP